ncbi:Hsp70 family protein [Couchioplanes caeruleus]|uniref:Hsp70 family protein n=1 Tax=Couchioplanes caeruleus TaxID=56438 RepID=UPI000A0428FA|nr:Hsp70 family protein [Couchioplanes caeruleus]
MYALGIDLGTTFTAAAIWRDGRAETVSLGDRSAAIPSVVLLRQDETFLTGDAAHRRGLSEPQRVAREFKRRMGDTTPILLGGVPQSAEALMSRLLRWVVDEVARREGGLPTAICVSHPANWGPYKMDLFRQAIRMADLDLPVTYTTEPEAAAVNYTQQQRVEQGTVVAVYDLGGGTFDAAVLRKTATGFEVMGQPEGIERLGGTDFDAAVFHHVRTALDGKLEELDEDDPAVINAVARLRDECVQAKEALSSDTDTTIPVLLPDVSTEIRLTRAEFEAMVRPALHGSVEALQRALRSADCTPEQVHSVLLVGGSSRMPIVAQLVGSELGRPVVADAHPKHSVALGAAWLAGGTLAKPASAAGVASLAVSPPQQATPATPPVVATPATPPVGAAAATPPVVASATPPAGVAPATAPAVPAASAGAPVRVSFHGEPVIPNPAPPVNPAPLPTTTVVGNAGVPAPSAGPVGRPARTTTYTSTTAVPAADSTAAASKPPAKRGRVALVAVGVALVVLLGGGAATWALMSGKRAEAGSDKRAEAGSDKRAVAASDKPAVPADEQCTNEIKRNLRWVCLTSAKVADGKFTVAYDAGFNGTPPAIKGGFHLHLYGSDGTNPPDKIMGEQAADDQQGFWYVEDQQPSVLSTRDQRFVRAIGDSPKVCARIAEYHHGLVTDSRGTYKTGNCVPIKWS